MNTDTGSCEHCGRSFQYRLIGNGMNGSFHAYCERCGNAVVSESLVDPRSIQFDPCACGGRVSYEASPRCPHCSEVLSATVAANYIERNSPGVAGGWRWQRTWKGGNAFVVDGRLLYNHPWRKL
jgi:hypothetical protein